MTIESEAFSRYRSLIDDWDSFIDCMRSPLPSCVWTNTLRTTPGRLVELMEEVEVRLEPLAWLPGAFRLPAGVRPGGLWPVTVGLCHVQEEVSMLPVMLLAPRPGERVLDLCAAPGNKMAQISVALENRGTVVANDINFERMGAVGHAIEKLGLVNVSTMVYNATNLPRGVGHFDKILVDVPCSCEGTSRKNPKVLEELCGGGYRKKVGLQKALLRKAVQLCRPGGRIVYSTCTFAPEENETVIEDMIGQFGTESVRLLSPSVERFRCSEGLREWQGERFHASMSRTLRVWPHHNDTGGFFLAMMEKVGEETAPGQEAPSGEQPAAEGDGASEEVKQATLPGPEADPEERLAMLARTFGIPPACFESRRFFQGSKEGVYVVNDDHLPPEAPRPDTTGLFFLRTDMKVPKPSTAAAMAFGARATRNVIDVSREQLHSYIHRRPIRVSAEKLASCDARGQVLVRHRGAALGVGFLRPDPDGAGGEVESWFPRGWVSGPD